MPGRERGPGILLLITVMKVLYENDLDDLPVRDLIRKCGVSEGTFYNVIDFLKKYNLVIEKEFLEKVKHKRGQRTIKTYKLSPKGRGFYLNVASYIKD